MNETKKRNLELVKASFAIMTFLEMRFSDGTGQDLQVALAHKEIMSIIKSLLKNIK